MKVLRPQATNPRVLELTRRALLASNAVKPNLRIVCAKCNRTLGRAGYTPAPLFTSTWETSIVAEVGIESLLHNTKAESRRQRYKVEREMGLEIEGALPVDRVESVIALLQLPPGYPDDYPDLLVRCARDGDLVLDRLEVLRRLRRGGSWPVVPRFPRCELEPVEDGWLTGLPSTQTTYTRTVRYGRPSAK